MKYSFEQLKHTHGDCRFWDDSFFSKPPTMKYLQHLNDLIDNRGTYAHPAEINPEWVKNLNNAGFLPLSVAIKHYTVENADKCEECAGTFSCTHNVDTVCETIVQHLRETGMFHIEVTTEGKPLDSHSGNSTETLILCRDNGGKPTVQIVELLKTADTDTERERIFNFRYSSWVDGELNDYENKPALVNNFYYSFWKENKMHKTDGPAFVGHMLPSTNFHYENQIDGSTFEEINNVAKNQMDSFTVAWVENGSLVESKTQPALIYNNHYFINKTDDNFGDVYVFKTSPYNIVKVFFNNVVEKLSHGVRSSADEPAVLRNNGVEEWWIQGNHVFTSQNPNVKPFEKWSQYDEMFKKATPPALHINPKTINTDSLTATAVEHVTHQLYADRQIYLIMLPSNMKAGSRDIRKVDFEEFKNLNAVKKFITNMTETGYANFKTERPTNLQGEKQTIYVQIHNHDKQNIWFTLGLRFHNTNDSGRKNWDFFQETAFKNNTKTNWGDIPQYNSSHTVLWGDKNSLKYNTNKPSIVVRQEGVKFLQNMPELTPLPTRIGDLMQLSSWTMIWGNGLQDDQTGEQYSVHKTMHDKETISVTTTGTPYYYHVASSEGREEFRFLGKSHILKK